jgi:predicted nucleotidyltransferase
MLRDSLASLNRPRRNRRSDCTSRSHGRGGHLDARAHPTELHAAGIHRLSLFGSAARGEAKRDSDIDLLVELDLDAHIGLIRLAAIELRVGMNYSVVIANSVRIG